MTPQVTIFLDPSGALHAEAPSTNGARRKLDLASQDHTNPDLFDTLRAAVWVIAEELQTQQRNETERKEREAERTRQLERARHARIVETTAARYPSELRHIDPAALRVTRKMHEHLRHAGYTNSEIKLMATRGELVGTAFWTVPRSARQTQTSSPSTPKRDRRADFERRVAAAAEIDP